jgi:hypothetical protein
MDEITSGFFGLRGCCGELRSRANLIIKRMIAFWNFQDPLTGLTTISICLLEGLTQGIPRWERHS